MNYEFMESEQKIKSQVLAGGRSRTCEATVTRPPPYPLDHEGLVERIILELPDEL